MFSGERRAARESAETADSRCSSKFTARSPLGRGAAELRMESLRSSRWLGLRSAAKASRVFASEALNPNEPTRCIPCNEKKTGGGGHVGAQKKP